MKNRHKLIMLLWAILAVTFSNSRAQQIDLQISPDQETILVGQELRVRATIQNFLPDNPDFLHTWVDQTGYRKLKLGNNPDNVYNPAIDVSQNGNSKVDITLRVRDGLTKWNKMLIRPNGIANTLKLSDYVSTDPAVNSWFTISIPLADFGSTVDWTQVKNLEFPYSAGANHYDWDIYSIIFSGGPQPVIWMGPDHVNNAHNGNGGPGEVYAQWQIQSGGDATGTPELDCYVDGVLVGSATGYQVEFLITDLLPGSHEIQVILQTDENRIESNTINLVVLDPIVDLPVIEVHPEYTAGMLPVNQGFRVFGQVSGVSEETGVTTNLLIDDQVISTSDSTAFDFVAIFNQPGVHNWSISARTDQGVETVAGPFELQIILPENDTRLTLVEPENESVWLQNEILNLRANYQTELPGVQPWLEVSNPGTGYRKLKLGSNPDNLYSPRMNWIGTGNTMLDITVKLLDGNPNLSKLVICPQEITTNAPTLATYWQSATILEDGWRILHIPLAAFDPSIDFTALAYLAFPYSRNAGYFRLGIRDITFSGGDPLVWFGQDKLDNIHDGFGNPGQLLASLVTAAQAPVPVELLFFAANTYIGSLSDQNLSLPFLPDRPGEWQIQVYALMSDGQLIAGGAIQIQVEEAPDQSAIQFKIILSDQSSPTIQKAPLRYNKSFAYSLSLDDGLADAYDHAFQIMNGGYIAEINQHYEGLFLTDGCGNDIPFTGSLAWFSVNRDYSDIHINTPGYVSWTELVDMYNAGWDVLNHSYSHATAVGTDFYWEIDQNQQAVLNKTGIQMTQFVIPGGGDYQPYQAEAIAYGMNAIYAYKSNFEGYPKGLTVDASRDWRGISIYRGYKYDSYYDSTNIMTTIDGIAAAAAPDKHVWYNDFTHRVHLQDYAGSLRVETFAYYLSEIAARYGKNGTDAVWVASLQAVWEYLFVRDNTAVTMQQNGNEVLVSLQTGTIPDNLRTKALSLLVESAGSFTVEPVTAGLHVSYNGSTGLINLEWDRKQASLKAGILDHQEEVSDFQLQIYPNPVADYLYLGIQSEEPVTKVTIFTMSGQILYQKDIRISGGKVNYLINRSEIQASGICLLQIVSGSHQEIHKLILQ